MLPPFASFKPKAVRRGTRAFETAQAMPARFEPTAGSVRGTRIDLKASLRVGQSGLCVLKSGGETPSC